MLYVICYDLPSSKAGNKRRRRLTKILEGFGKRVQYSVFEMRANSGTEFQDLLIKMELEIDAAEDSLRIYRIHEDMESEIIIYGHGEVYKVEDAYFF
jgi:CRISPR-associated protein Cas2